MYRSILAIASRMSSTRNRHSLGGKHRLGKDPISQLRLQRGTGYELDLSSDALTEFPLQAHGQVVGRLDITGQRHGVPVGEKLTSVAKLVADVELAVAGLTRSRQAPRLDPAPAADALRLERVHSS